jgi:hypothetical protein
MDEMRQQYKEKNRTTMYAVFVARSDGKGLTPPQELCFQYDTRYRRAVLWLSPLL